VITTEAVRAWCLVSGEWVEREDPVMAVCDPYGGDVRAAMGSLGYEIWCQVGVEDLPAVPISLAVYSREAPPLQFLLQLEGNAGNVVEHIFAETLPDAMELLTRWAPIARTRTHDARVVVAGGRAEDDSRRPGDVPGRPESGTGLPEDASRRPEDDSGHAEVGPPQAEVGSGRLAGGDRPNLSPARTPRPAVDQAGTPGG
jgi:hypothetical protein